jgi:hypothetical protein
LNFPPVVPGYRSTATATPKNNRGTGEYFEPVDYTCRRRIHDNEQPLSLDPRSSANLPVLTKYALPDSVPYTATLQVFDNAPGSPHVATLTGID